MDFYKKRGIDMKKTGLEIVKKIHLLIMAVTFFLSIRNVYDYCTLGNFNTLTVLAIMSFLCNAAAMVFGLLYLIYDYKKDVAKYYRWFMILVGLSFTFRAVRTVLDDKPLVRTVMTVVSLITLLVFAFKKDLGRKNTWIVYGVLLAVELLMKTRVQSTNYNFAILSSGFSNYLLISTIGLMINGKYFDKRMRNTD